jgi:hypothetical protein
MLDALLSPEWEDRYYSFNQRWSLPSGTRMGSMRNGSGDDLFILFFPDGSAALKGFDHESSALDGRTAIAGVFEGLPERFREFANEPAFTMNAATFCLWSEGAEWKRSPALAPETVDADGSGEMLIHLLGTPADYVAFASDYYEMNVPEEVVARFFELEPLTPELVGALHGDADVGPIATELDEIGYPLAVRG